MAWTSPRTWVAAAVITATQLNTHLRDNLQALVPLDAMAHTSWTPTLTQSGGVTKTTTAKYQQYGKTVFGHFVLSVTGTGSALNFVTVTTPVTMAISTVNDIVGEGFIYDSSATTKYRGLLVMNSTTTMKFLTLHSTSDNYLGAVDFTAALANNDIVAGHFWGEAA